MSFTIKFKRGTASEWNNSAAPSGVVLALGEPGYEKDTGKLKIGNGTTPWGLLPYVGLEPNDEYIQDLLASFIQNGSGISVVHNDNLDTLTINVTGLNSSYINDFNEAVDDRIGNGLFIGGTGIFVSYNDSGNSFTVSTTGVSLSGHTHNSSDITNFASSVSGLLPSISVSGQASSSFINNTYIISVTGLQPSGNYSLVGHTHTASDISNFNSSVSGLLPTIANSGDNRLLTSTGTTTGINGENNLTFDGSLLNIIGSGNFSGGLSGSLLNIDNIRIDGNTILSNNTNGLLCIAPTGTGPLQADTRRNARGAYATDLQRSATSNSQVSSGTNSTISGGANNTASGTDAVVGGGASNTASGSDSIVCGGFINSATAAASTVVGGVANIANNEGATVVGGYSNNANYGAGKYSFIGGGQNNNCENQYGIICGGNNNRITGGTISSVIGGGYLNLINSSGNFNTIGGGAGNVIEGTDCTILGGNTSTIKSSYHCSIIGGQGHSIETNTYGSVIINGLANNIQTGADYAVAGGIRSNASLYGEQSYSAGMFNTIGDSQTRRFILRGRSTTSSTIHLKLDGNVTGSKYLYVPDWTSWYYTIKVIARRNSPIGSTSATPTSDTGAYRFEGAIENKNNDGSSCVLLGNTKIIIHEDDAGWDCNIGILWDANNNAYLDIECSYDHTTEDVYWVASVDVVQVSVPIEGPSAILACGFGGFTDGPFNSDGFYNDREYYIRDDSGTYYYLFWNGSNWIISSSLGGAVLYSSPTYLPIGNDWTVNVGTPAGGDTYDYLITSTCPSASQSSSSQQSSSSTVSSSSSSSSSSGP